MGEDKSLLPFGGFSTLTQFQFSRLTPLFQSVHVNAKEDKFNAQFPLIKDISSDVYSPMVALFSILSNFKNSYVFCLSVDTPFVGLNEIGKLYKNLENYDAIIPQCDGTRHPLCGFYHTRIAPKILELIEKDIHKIGALLNQIDTLHVEFENGESFYNLNTPEHFQNAKQMAISNA